MTNSQWTMVFAVIAIICSIAALRKAENRFQTILAKSMFVFNVTLLMAEIYISVFKF